MFQNLFTSVPFFVISRYTFLISEEFKSFFMKELRAKANAFLFELAGKVLLDFISLPTKKEAMRLRLMQLRDLVFIQKKNDEDEDDDYAACMSPARRGILQRMCYRTLRYRFLSMHAGKLRIQQ